MEWFAWLRPVAQLSLDEWLKILQLAVTTIVSATVAYVTYKFQQRQAAIAAEAVTVAKAQRQLAADKIRMDLFEHRLAVYRELTGQINYLKPPDVPYGPSRREKVIRTINEVQFLFGEEVFNFLLKEYFDVFVEYDQAQVEQDFEKIVEMRKEQLRVLYRELDTVIFPYLRVNIEKFTSNSFSILI